MPLVDPVTMSTQATMTSAGRSSVQPNSTAASPGITTTQPKLQPIQIHTSTLSQASRFALPFLNLVIFFTSFSKLVADPVSTMTSLLPITTVLQVVYALICLPSAGSDRSSAKPKKLKPGEKKKANTAGLGFGPDVFLAAFVALVLSTVATPLLHIVMILFGAPFLTHQTQTLLCAAQLSILTLFPVFYVHGVDPTALVAVIGVKDAPLDEVMGGLLGGFVGAWLGAVPIPLDWDREWQKWPITILCGVFAGAMVGRVACGTILWGKRWT